MYKSHDDIMEWVKDNKGWLMTIEYDMNTGETKKTVPEYIDPEDIYKFVSFQLEKFKGKTKVYIDSCGAERIMGVKIMKPDNVSLYIYKVSVCKEI